jgi:FKBP-type peptidyl-prolyl cis-trans isomerase FkpA
MSMFKLTATVLLTLLVAPAFAAEPLKTEEQKTLYAVGQIVGRQLSVFHLTPADFESVKLGLADAVLGAPPAVQLSAYSDKVQELARARRKAVADQSAGANQALLEQAAAEKGAVTTASGLVYLSLKEGSGAAPKPDDAVLVHYRGTLPDGKEFDSSYRRGKPMELRLNGVIKCWTEALQKMKPGGKARLVCPASLAYGDAGAGELILPGATLAFEVELLEIKK